MYSKAVQGYEVPYNWDYSMPRFLGEINARDDTQHPITSVYAADRWSVTGSGRPGNSLAERTRPYREYFDAFHAQGIAFKYVMNAPYHGGRELTQEMQIPVLKKVDELVEAGVDSLTITAPFLAMVIHEHFPDLALSTSVNNHLDSIERVRQLLSYVPYGTIIVDHRYSRNFPLIRLLREQYPKHDLTVLANESCLADCVLQSCHQDLLGNMSRAGGSGDITIDWCHCLCAREKLDDPVKVLKAPWVRPDDAHYLFEAGATTVKLAGRTMSRNWILRLAAAYAAGRFDGLNVWPLIEKSGLTAPDWENVLRRELRPCRYIVRNADLDGFIEPFVNGSAPCVRRAGGCADCGHCAKWTAKAVDVPANRQERRRDLDDLMDALLGRRAQQRDDDAGPGSVTLPLPAGPVPMDEGLATNASRS